MGRIRNWIAELLADAEERTRTTAAEALGIGGSELGLPLLRLKALMGDPEPRVLGACFASLLAIAPGPFPTTGATGQLRPEGRDDGAARNPLGRVGDHAELANLASFLISDQGGYINGEMVVQDGGAHLRSSGAEDLLQWTDAQWEKLRASRRKDRG